MAAGGNVGDGSLCIAERIHREACERLVVTLGLGGGRALGGDRQGERHELAEGQQQDRQARRKLPHLRPQMFQYPRRALPRNP
jgi:hypothetical protein